MNKPTNAQVHLDAVLTNISIAYMQRPENFVSTRMFPNVPVLKQSDRYYTFDRGDINRDEARVRAPATESAGGAFSVDNTPNYYCPVISFHKDVPWQTEANADSVVDLSRGALDYVNMKLMIRKEVDFMSTYLAPSVWAFDWDGVASGPTGNQVVQWSNYANSDPITDIRNAKRAVLESTGFEPNKLLLGAPVWDNLVDHPDIVDRVKYSGGVGNDNPARVTRRTIAQLLELEDVVVSKAIYNTAAEGDTNDHSFIAGKRALLCYAPPEPSLMTPSAGYTFSWTGYMDQGNEFGAAVKRIPMDTREADRIEGSISFCHKLVGNDLGFFWDTIVA